MISKLTPIQVNTIIIVLAIALQKIATFVRDCLLAKYFGIGQMLDIYFYAMIIPIAIFNVVFGSFSYFFVPAYWNIKTKTPDRLKEQVNSLFIYVALILGILAFIYIWLLSDVLVFINPTLFSTAESISLFKDIIPWITVFTFFYSLSCFFSSLLQAEHHYTASLLPQTFIPVFSGLFIVCRYTDMGIRTAIYGIVIGACINFFFMYFYCIKRKLFSLSSTITNINDVVKMFNIKQFVMLIFVFILSGTVTFIDQHMASKLGQGNLAILNYGQMIPDGIFLMLSFSIGTAIFSYLSNWISQGNTKDVVAVTQKAIAQLSLFLIPVIIFLFLNASPIIALCFERGLFSMENTTAVQNILASYVFSIYLLIVGSIGSRIVSAMQKNEFLVKVMLLVIGSKLIFNTLMIKTFNLQGIPFATTITFMLSCTSIFIYLKRQGYDIFSRMFIKYLAKYIGLAAIISFLIISLHYGASLPATFGLALEAMAMLICFSLVIFANKYLGAPNLLR